jgi:hypothetical protein
VPSTGEELWRRASINTAVRAGNSGRKLRAAERELARLRGEGLALHARDAERVARYAAPLEHSLSRALAELRRL